ncbi:hypothetical protein PA598K_03204 [Paenibacillus sp. 598K]|nr:hypothetical protein PA598K_03204 [Paenibacillus sp. 598K]
MLVCLLWSGLAEGWSVPNAAAADRFDVLRERWKTLLTGGAAAAGSDADITVKRAAIDALAQSRWDTLQTSPTRACLWTDLCSTTISSHITDSYGRLKDMAIAYATPGSTLAGDPALLADLLSALDWMHAQRYNASATPYNNWWDWQIGAPLRLNDLMVLLYDELGTTRIASYAAAIEARSPIVEMTGANRVWKITVVGLRGVIVKDAAKLAAASNGLSDVLSYVTSGDGFYADGSFIQHYRYPYTGGYGLSLISDIAGVLYLLDGSDWRVIDPRLGHVYRWVREAFEPILYKGALMDMTRGREMSRAPYQDHYAGNRATQAILRLSQTAPDAERPALQRLVKAMIAEDTYYPFFEKSTMYNIVLGKQLMADPTVVPREPLVMNRVFAGMDRVVHLREGFGFGISMSSARVFNFEAINGENLKGWFTGDGMTYLYNDDLSHYSDDYWATVDPYRLPGTTIDTNPRLNSSGYEYLSPSHWVGGVILDEAYGAAGMELDAWGNTLSGRKSWFLFDEELVALGAGIASTDNRPIVTNVEHRKLAGPGTSPFTVDGAAALTTAPGAAETVTGAQWAHLAGDMPGSDIGYYFPDGADLEVQRTLREGSWRQINATGPETPISRVYQSIRINHGPSPVDATYSYVLLPGLSSAEAEAYAANPSTTILVNTPAVQAVRQETLQATGANFWTTAGGTAGGITSSGQASVMTRVSGDELRIAVADPTQQAQDYLVIELEQPAQSVISTSSGVYVTRLSPTVQLHVDVQGARGESFEAALRLAPPPASPDSLPDRSDWLFHDDFAYGTAPGWEPMSVAASGTVPACGAAHWSVARAEALGGAFAYTTNQPAGECRSLIRGVSAANYSIELTGAATPWSAGGSALSLIGRYVDAQNYYRFGFTATDAAGNGNWRILKRQGGVWTVLATSSATSAAAGSSYRVKAELQGSQLRLYVDSGSGYALQASVTDASFASGRSGLLTYKGGTQAQEVLLRKLTP